MYRERICFPNRLVCVPRQVHACGSLVTEEHPYAMIVPIEFFLMRFGYHRQPQFASSASNGSNPTSPSSHSCIAPELLSPESLGIKLKPIKTRAGIDIWHKERCLYELQVSMDATQKESGISALHIYISYIRSR